jgi:hypothetical protein
MLLRNNRLDDSSHDAKDRQERDSLMDRILAAAGLPIVRVPAQHGYVVETLRAQFDPYLGAGRAAEGSVIAGASEAEIACRAVGVVSEIL